MSQAPHTDVFALVCLLQSHGVAVSFAHAASYAPTPTDVVDVVFGLDAAGGETALITTPFLGLAGAVSPLPEQATLALEAAAGDEDNSALGAHLAQLHGALQGALHAGVARNTLGAATACDFSDALSQMLLQHTGHAKALSDQARLAAWAALKQGRCSAEQVCWAVGTVLRRLGLTTSLRLTALTGRPRPLAGAVLCALGGQGAVLGETSIVGDHGSAKAAAVQLALGPVDLPWLQRCTAQQEKVAQELAAMLRATLPLHVRAEVTLILGAQAVGPCRLGDVPAVSPALGPQQLSLFGLGLRTFLGAPTGAQTVWWPLHGADG